MAFELENITEVALRHKKIIAPIVIGGIIAPLCLLAIMKAMFNPWFSLTGGFIGGFLMYYGWIGSKCIAINTKVKEYNLFIRTVSKNLSAFIKYTNDSLPINAGDAGRYLFMVPGGLPNKSSQEGKTMLFTYAQAMRWLKSQQHRNTGLITIDPTLLSSEVKFEMPSGADELFPYVYGNIPSDAIIQNEGVLVFGRK